MPSKSTITNEVLQEKISSLDTNFKEYKTETNKKLDEILLEMRNYNAQVSTLNANVNMVLSQSTDRKIEFTKHILEEFKPLQVTVSEHKELVSTLQGSFRTLNWLVRGGLASILTLVGLVVYLANAGKL